MVTLVDKIHFQSVLSLIYGRYVGYESEYSDFFLRLSDLTFSINRIIHDSTKKMKRIEAVNRGYTRQQKGKIVTVKTIFYPVSEAIKGYPNKLRSIKNDILLNDILNPRTANEICGVYKEVIDQLAPFKGAIDKLVDSRINSIENRFESLNLSFNNVSIDKTTLEKLHNNKDIEGNADELIIESLSSFLFASFLCCKDYEIIYRSLKNISKRLDEFLRPQIEIMPEDILEVLSHLPQPLYRGLLYYQSQKKNLGDRAYFELVTAVQKNNLDVFSRTIFDNNLYYGLSSYFEFFAMMRSLRRGNRSSFEFHVENLSNDSSFVIPREFIKKIRDFNSSNSLVVNRTVDTRKMAAFTVAIFNEVKSLFADEHLQLISNLINSDDVVRERFSFYERVGQWHSTHPAASDDSTPQTTENSSLELQLDHYGDIPTKEPPQSNEVFNCIMPEEDIDQFLNYLAWRGYIIDEDKQMFKNIVFGGVQPTNRGVIKFNKANSGKSMLGVIVWMLRNDVSNLSNINIAFDDTIHKSNSYIGTNKDSQRIFVDVCLFFPSLINALIIRDKNKKDANRIISDNLKKRVQELHERDDYKNCSSILEFIKQIEEQDVQYWVVSKK